VLVFKKPNAGIVQKNFGLFAYHFMLEIPPDGTIEIFFHFFSQSMYMSQSLFTYFLIFLHNAFRTQSFCPLSLDQHNQGRSDREQGVSAHEAIFGQI
jgi:hypothetical protein